MLFGALRPGWNRGLKPPLYKERSIGLHILIPTPGNAEPNKDHYDGDLSELKDIHPMQSSFVLSNPDSIQKSAIGAAQVAELPALVGGSNLGMQAAYGCFVQDDFEIICPSGPQARARFPNYALVIPVDATQTNQRLHNPLP